MKTSISQLVLSLVVFAAASMTTAAQEYTTYIRTLDVDTFDKVAVELDTEVILIKSDSNRVTLAGDSAFIFNQEVNVKDGTLSLSYNNEPENKLYRVIIQYTDLDRMVAGGEGIYYLHKTNLDNLVLFNPEAQVFVSGAIGKLRLVSDQGFNDISKLQATNKYLHIGDTATLINAEEDAELFVATINE